MDCKRRSSSYSFSCSSSSSSSPRPCSPPLTSRNKRDQQFRRPQQQPASQPASRQMSRSMRGHVCVGELVRLQGLTRQRQQSKMSHEFTDVGLSLREACNSIPLMIASMMSSIKIVISIRQLLFFSFRAFKKLEHCNRSICRRATASFDSFVQFFDPNR